jgi:hypothetical protein
MTVPTSNFLVESFANVPETNFSENLGNFRFFSVNLRKFVCKFF